MSDPGWQERVTRESSPAILVEHRVRYRLAAPLIEGAPIWADLGCGNGIAAAEALRESRPRRALLVDLAADALAVAARELEGTGAETLLADLASEEDLGRVREALLADGAGGGCVTCFEVVEHLPTFLPLLDLLKELTADRAFTAVLSVPNDAFWSIENPFHTTMWGEGAFEELLRLLPDDRVIAHQFALQGSIAVVEGIEARPETVGVEAPLAAIPTHFLVAFGPGASGLGRAADVAEADLLEQRRWERQRESDLAHMQATQDRLADWRTYIHELEGKLGLPLSGTRDSSE
jgi:SAM-dependent methyltransferase